MAGLMQSILEMVPRASRAQHFLLILNAPTSFSPSTVVVLKSLSTHLRIHMRLPEHTLNGLHTMVCRSQILPLRSPSPARRRTHKEIPTSPPPSPHSSRHCRRYKSSSGCSRGHECHRPASRDGGLCVRTQSFFHDKLYSVSARLMVSSAVSNRGLKATASV